MMKLITFMILTLLSICSPSFGREWTDTLNIIKRRPRFAIKTNLLYCVALAPNIGFEYYMYSQWSVNAVIAVPWWSNKEDGHFYQALYLNSELKYWLRPDAKFERHFMGLYLGGGYYDFKYNETGYRGDFIFTAGLSYGYYLPIKPRFGMEFSLGIGYMETQYDKYLNYPPMGNDAYYQTSTDKTRYFGPTKAEISLVWRLGNKIG